MRTVGELDGVGSRMPRLARLVLLAGFLGFSLGALAMAVFVACAGPWR